MSRASDEVLFRLAGACPAAVLVNWWNHDTAPARLRAIADETVEVFCDCPIEVAAARFAARKRHPGHLDRLRTQAEHSEGVRRLRESFQGPLGVSEALVTVDTYHPVDADALVQDVRTAIASARAGRPST